MQVPARQLSPELQRLPSLQAVPFGAGSDAEHLPVVGLHVPLTWHWSCGAQVTGLPPAQTPAWQVSVCVQAFPSLQGVPFGFARFEHVPFAGSQVPASWHGSLGAHITGFAPMHAPV